MTYELQSLQRALDLLTLLATTGPMRLTEICERLDANPTTILRTLRVLEREGLVRRPADGMEYRLGTRLAELGQSAIAGIDVPGTLRPWTSALTRSFASTTHVGMLRGGMVTIVDKVDAIDSVVRYSSLGTRMPLHATAIGKAVLALVGPDRMDDAGLEPPLAAYTKHSITDLPLLRTEIEETVERGYSIEREEYNLGYACVGTAFSLGGEVYGVSLSGQVADEAEIARRGASLEASIDEFLQSHRGAAQGLTRPGRSTGR